MFAAPDARFHFTGDAGRDAPSLTTVALSRLFGQHFAVGAWWCCFCAHFVSQKGFDVADQGSWF